MKRFYSVYSGEVVKASVDTEKAPAEPFVMHSLTPCEITAQYGNGISILCKKVWQSFTKNDEKQLYIFFYYSQWKEWSWENILKIQVTLLIVVLVYCVDSHGLKHLCIHSAPLNFIIWRHFNAKKDTLTVHNIIAAVGDCEEIKLNFNRKTPTKGLTESIWHETGHECGCDNQSQHEWQNAKESLRWINVNNSCSSMCRFGISSSNATLQDSESENINFKLCLFRMYSFYKYNEDRCCVCVWWDV